MKAIKTTPFPRLAPSVELDIWRKRSKLLKSFMKDRLVIPVSAETHIIEYSKILFISADGNYSRITLTDGSCIVCAKTLKHFEVKLLDKKFLRVHASYLVNLNHVTGLSKSDGLSIRLSNEQKIPISRTFKNQLFRNIPGA